MTRQADDHSERSAAPLDDGHVRRRAAGLLGFVNGLMVATGSKEYAREVGGIGGLLAQQDLDDSEALARAAGAFERMRHQMRTSRDEFHLMHPDKARQDHVNDRLDAALDELSLLLAPHVVGE